MSQRKVIRNKVYSKDIEARSTASQRIEMRKESSNQETPGEDNPKHKWSHLLKSMILDCNKSKKNTGYYAIMQARMHKNLNEREIEFGSHQEITSFAFQKDLLVASSNNGLIYAYKVTDKSIKEIAKISGHFTEIDSLEVAKGGSLVFSSSKNSPLMLSTRKAEPTPSPEGLDVSNNERLMLSERKEEGALSSPSKGFQSISLDNHLGRNSISFQSLDWIEQLSTLVALDFAGVLRFIQFHPDSNALKQVITLSELLPEMNGRVVEGVRVSRNGVVIGFLEKDAGGNTIKVLSLTPELSLTASDSIDARSTISDFSVSENGKFIAVRTNSGSCGVWENSQRGTFSRATPTDIAIQTQDSVPPKISISGRGNYFSVSDSKSSKILVFRSKKTPEGEVQLEGQRQGYQPSIEIETLLGLQKMEIVDNERFAVCLFNSNLIKLLSIQHIDHTDDEVFSLRKRNSSLLGTKRFGQILEQLKNSKILHIEEAFDGSKTLAVNKGLSVSTNQTKGGRVKEEPKPLDSQNTPSQLSMGNEIKQGTNQIAIYEDPEEDEEITLIVTIWDTSKASQKQLALDSSFKISLLSVNSTDTLLKKVSRIDDTLNGVGSAGLAGKQSPNGFYRFRGVLVDLRKIEQDFFFRVSRDFSTVILGSENHLHIWKKQGASYELDGTEPIDTGTKIDSLSFFGKKNGFIVGGRDNKLRIYSETGDLIQTLDAHSLRVSSCTGSSDGDVIITGSMDLSLKVWAKEKLKKKKRSQNGIPEEPDKYSLSQQFDTIHSSRVELIALSEDSKLLITSSKSETLLFTKNRDEKPFIKSLTKKTFKYSQIQILKEGFSQIFISLDRKYVVTRGVASEGTGGKVKLWQVVDHKLVLVYDLGESKTITLSEKNFRDMFILKAEASAGNDQRTQGEEKSEPVELVKLKVTPKIEDNFDMEKKVLKLFDNKVEFIDKDNLNSMIEYLEQEVISKVEGESEELKTFKTDLIIHGRVNLLLIAVLSRNPAIISQILEKYGYKPFFYKKGLDPIRAAFQIDNGSCLEVIAEYLENNDIIRRDFVTHSTFVKAMNTGNDRLKKIFIETFLSPPQELEWAKLQPIDQFPMNNHLYWNSVSNSTYYDQDLRDSLQEKKLKELKNLPENSNMDQVRMIVTHFQISPLVMTRKGYQMIKALNKVPDEMFVGDLKYMIRGFWWVNYFFIWLFSTYKITALVYFIFSISTPVDQRRNSTITMFLNAFLLILEFLVMKRAPRVYFRQLDNIMDLYQYSNIPIICFLLRSDTLEQENLGFNLWINLTMTIAGFRILFALRMYDSVRYLVSMILQTMIDMIGFVIISIATILVFCGTSLNLLWTTEVDPIPGPTAYWRSWKVIFEIFFGNWEDPLELNYPQYINHLVNSVFIALVMANLLIGIISQTFADYVEKRELVDFREMLSILTELADLFSYLRPKRKDKEVDPDEGIFVCFVVKKQEDEAIDQVAEGIERLEERQEEIMQKIEERFDRIDKQFEMLMKKDA